MTIKAKDKGAPAAEETQIVPPEIEELDNDQGDEGDSATSAEFDSAFNEFEDDDAGKGKGKAKKAEPKLDDDDDDDGKGDPKPEDSKAKAEDKKPAATEETATERMERLAKEAEAPSKKPEPKPKEEPKPDPKPKAEEPAAPAAKAKAEKITFDTLLDAFDPEKKAKVKEFFDDFPEMREVTEKMTELFGANAAATQEAKPQAEPEKKSAATENQEMDSEAARVRLLYNCERKHPGAIAIVESTEFQGWLETQSAGIKTLADSGDVESSVTIIQAYQENKAKTAAKAVDDKNQNKRNKVNELHKSTAKTKGAKAPGGSSEPDDFDSAFDDFADDED